MVSGISPGCAAQVGPSVAGAGERLGLGEADCYPASVLGAESSFSPCAVFRSQPFQCVWVKVTGPVPSYPMHKVDMELPCDEHTRRGKARTADSERLGPHWVTVCHRGPISSYGSTPFYK